MSAHAWPPVTVSDADGMRALGEALGRTARAGDVIVLSGPLGAGKTTWVQGFAQGLGVRGPVTSPTFVIARPHPSREDGPALVHVDAYRLSGDVEFEDLGLAESADEVVTVVEWGEGRTGSLGVERLVVTIDRAGEGDGAEGPRTVSMVGYGDRWAPRLDQ